MSTSAEYVERLVAEAPPLTQRQRAQLRELLAPLRGETSHAPLPPRQPTERELKRERLTEQAKAIAAAVQACAICGTPIFVHKRSGHPWEPNEAAITRHLADTPPATTTPTNPPVIPSAPGT